MTEWQQAAVLVGVCLGFFFLLVVVLFVAEAIGGRGTAITACYVAMKTFQEVLTGTSLSVTPNIWSRIIQVLIVVCGVGMLFVMMAPVLKMIGQVLEDLPVALREQKRQYQQAQLRQKLFGKAKLTPGSIAALVLVIVFLAGLWLFIFRPHTILDWATIPVAVVLFLFYLRWLRKP